MSYYSQQDPRWKNSILGFNPGPPWTLGDYGCLVTAFSNMLKDMGQDQDPSVVNARLKALNGFTPGSGTLIWGVAPQLSSDIVPRGTTTDFNQANQFVQAPQNYAILQVSKPGFPMHFVVLNRVGLIADSIDGVEKPWPSGYTLHVAHLYGDATPFATSPQPAVAASAQLTNNEEPLMTADQERQAYEIVLAREPENPGALGHRSGWQFIDAARGELAGQRQAHANEVSARDQQITTLQAQIATLNEQLTTARNETQPEPAPAKVEVTVASDHHDGPVPVVQDNAHDLRIQADWTSDLAHKPKYQLDHGIVTDLGTGLDIGKTNPEATITVVRVVKRPLATGDDLIYMQTKNMVDLNRGISEAHFQFASPLTELSAPPSAEDVGKFWSHLTGWLHKKSKE